MNRSENMTRVNKAKPRGVGSRGGLTGEALRKRRVAAALRTQRKKREMVQRYRNERGCMECGEKHPATLDLHHRDGEEKHDLLKPDHARKRSTRGWGNLSFAAIEAELQKCIVLCSNCHRILTARERAAANQGE